MQKEDKVVTALKEIDRRKRGMNRQAVTVAALPPSTVAAAMHRVQATRRIGNSTLAAKSTTGAANLVESCLKHARIRSR